VYISEVTIVEGGISTPYSSKCPPNVQPREYLRELAIMLVSPGLDVKLKTTYGISASRVTSATLTFAT